MDFLDTAEILQHLELAVDSITKSHGSLSRPVAPFTSSSLKSLITPRMTERSASWCDSTFIITVSSYWVDTPTPTCSILREPERLVVKVPGNS